MRAIPAPAELAAWAASSMTCEDIARKAGVSVKTARRWLEIEGLIIWRRRVPRSGPGYSKMSPDHRAARDAARAIGAKQFDGDPCANGHPGRRFVINNRCQDCNAASRPAPRAKPRSPSALAREEARARGNSFYEGAPCKYGHGRRRYTTNAWCVVCHRARLKGRPRIETPEQRERRLARNRDPIVKLARCEANKRRYREDSTYRLTVLMRSAVHHTLRRKGGDKAGRSWAPLVGYSVEELKRHLERQFTKGMGWHNAHLWQIDHIIPVASFGAMSAGDDEFRACWALSNLRPLWKSLNIAKGAKREHLL